MATTVLDLRRTDERAQVLKNPFWLESALIEPAADDKASILFSFSTTKAAFVIVHEVAIRIISAFTGDGTEVLNIGTHTLATDAVTTGGTASLVDADDYIPTASITLGTAGLYVPAGGDFLTAKAAGTLTGPTLITCAATTVPCISAELSSDDVITGGQARVYALVSYLP